VEAMPDPKDSTEKRETAKPKNKKKEQRAIERRKNHPLVKRLKEIRNRHNKKQVDVEACMAQRDPQLVSEQMVKRIEEGRRDLPGIIGATSPPLSEWIDAWLTCVEATDAERADVEELLMKIVLGQLEYDLPARRSDA
jgi:hypothetical protein